MTSGLNCRPVIVTARSGFLVKTLGECVPLSNRHRGVSLAPSLTDGCCH